MHEGVAHCFELMQALSLFQVFIASPGTGSLHGLFLLQGGTYYPIYPARAKGAAYGAP